MEFDCQNRHASFTTLSVSVRETMLILTDRMMLFKQAQKALPKIYDGTTKPAQAKKWLMSYRCDIYPLYICISICSMACISTLPALHQYIPSHAVLYSPPTAQYTLIKHLGSASDVRSA